MGIFDLPSGDFELLFKDNGKEEWKSVMMIDRLTKEEIAECVERWSENHIVTGARYNGRIVEIPTEYYWEIRSKGETLQRFSKRKDAVKELEKRRLINRKNKAVVPLSIVFVQ